MRRLLSIFARSSLVILIAASFVACCSGERVSVSKSTKASVSESVAVGFRPEVQAAITVPPEAIGCLIDAGHAMAVDAKDGVICFLQKLFPAVQPVAATRAAAAPEDCVPVYASPARRSCAVPGAASTPAGSNCPNCK